MKFSFKKFLSLVLAISIFSFNVFTINATYNEILEKNGIQITKSKYSKTIKTESSTQTTIDQSSLKLLKNKSKEKNLSLYEQNVIILQELGFSDITISTMTPSDIENLFQNAIEITTETIYMKSNPDGTTSIISEANCMNAIETKNNTVATTAGSNDGWGNYPSDDGYMRLTISSEYLNPSSMNNEKGWYYFHTWYEWLSVPSHRMKDAISIAAPNFTWDTFNADGAYCSTMYYRHTDINGYDGRVDANLKTTQDLTVASNGIYYEWYMPLSATGVDMYYIQFYIRARARVSFFESPQSVGVYTKYVHTYATLDLEPTFSWTLVDQIGVSLNPHIVIKSNDYYFNIAHSYTP